MSDIFISYASEDRDRVQSLARALEREGWSVWWDRRIPTGRSFSEVIQEALGASKAVVVVWSTRSVKSSWVQNETRKGLRRGVLFPVMLLDEVEIPLEFEHVQAAQLMDWQPEESHSGFDQFVQDIARVLGPPPGPGAQQPPVKQPREEPPSQTKPTSKIESLSGRAGQVKQEGGRLERKPSTPIAAISVPLDSPVESSSSLAGMQSQEPAQIHIPEGEGRVTGATDSTPPLQSQRYILIGIGLFLVMGAFVAYWILSLGSSPMKKGEPPSQTWAQDISQVKKGVVKITAQVEGTRRIGTGFVVGLEKDAAYIVTAAHVIEGDPKPSVTFFSQQETPYPGTIRNIEGGEELGLALLMVKAQADLLAKVTMLPLNVNAQLSGGEDVLTIGSPRSAGPWAIIKGSVVSRQGRKFNINSNLDEGNSGGPIIHDGQVVGLIVALRSSFGLGVTAKSVQEYLEGFNVTPLGMSSPNGHGRSRSE
jgi:S1-C subfamily serine protease